MHSTFFLLLRRMRTPLVVLLLAYAISITGFLFIPGMDNTGQPWRMDIFHAFYFVSFMGSTIGFGEVPYPFTDAQRLWTLLCIYLTVISWLYAIGTLISLLQNPAFRASVTYNSFVRQVTRLREPFYIVCGCGDAGLLLIKALTSRGIRVVALDQSQTRINILELEDLDISVPAICDDASNSDALKAAGLGNICCEGIVALTSDDEVNLKIAIISKLLSPALKVICRAETHDAAKNMDSFGTDHIINAYETFAEHLAISLTSPNMYLLHDWLSSASGIRIENPVAPPHGHWILCGYGRFGKEIKQRFDDHGNDITVIEVSPDASRAPPDAIKGRGTEAETLVSAGIENAVGLIAGTDNDANNLSIVMTASSLNPELFIIARQNRSRNDEIFRAANLNLVTHNSKLLASRSLALITTPLTTEFLANAETADREWVDALLEQLRNIVGDETLQLWMIDAQKDILQKHPNLRVSVENLTRDLHDRKHQLDCIVLMIKRDSETIMLPEGKQLLTSRDRVLICGRNTAKRSMLWALSDPGALAYMCSGKRPAAGWLWRRFGKAS